MLLWRFTFGDFLLDPQKGTLLRHDQPVPIGQRGIRLLETLLRRKGEVVTKAELIDAAWGGLAIEESNLSVQIAALRKILGAMPDGGEWIATIPRVGYRFVGSVGSGEVPEAVEGLPPSVAPAEMLRREPSIAVLPFDNLSDDPEHEYFADGLTEEIITGLSRLRWILVAARNSSFAYRSKTADVRQVGRELGVRYLLRGSIRRSGQRVRIAAQLIDVTSATQVWSERYDSELVDFFALQDQITESVVTAIEPYLFATEGVRPGRKTAESLEAWGFVMRAMPYIWTWAADDNETAVAYLRQAIAIAPQYARANALLAWVYAQRLNIGWAPILSSREFASSFARLAMEQDTEDAWAHLALGYIHSMSRQFEAAVAELTTALELNPSFAFAHAMLGMAYGYAALSDRGLHHISLALRLSPRDPQQAPYLSAMGLCHFMARRFSEAVEFQQRCVQIRPHFASAWRTLAAAAALQGNRDVAASALIQAMRLQPQLSVQWIEKYHPIVHEKDRAIYIKGLRAAGLK
jgi:TolB-like protein/Flp pilus assembly protein TadD